MDVIASRNSQMFHRTNCTYVKRIHKENRIYLDDSDILLHGYSPCSVCSVASRVAKKYHKRNPRIFWDRKHDGVCIRTDDSFWRAKFNSDQRNWVLYHQNSKGTKCFDKVAPDEILMQGAFHKQSDFGAVPPDKFDRIFEYIGKHDHFRRICEDDYRKLPAKDRKREKKRRKKAGLRKVNKLFRQLEKEKGANKHG